MMLAHFTACPHHYRFPTSNSLPSQTFAAKTIFTAAALMLCLIIIDPANGCVPPGLRGASQFVKRTGQFRAYSNPCSYAGP